MKYLLISSIFFVNFAIADTVSCNASKRNLASYFLTEEQQYLEADNDFLKRVRETFSKPFVSDDDQRLICKEAEKNNISGRELTFNDIPNHIYRDINGIVILGCLKIQDINVQEEVAKRIDGCNGCPKPNHLIASYNWQGIAIKSLEKMRAFKRSLPMTLKIANFVRKQTEGYFYNYQTSNRLTAAMEAIEFSGHDDEALQDELSSIGAINPFYNEDGTSYSYVSTKALKVLESIGATSDKAKWNLLSLLDFHERVRAELALEILKENLPTNSEQIKSIFKLAVRSKRHRELAKIYLKNYGKSIWQTIKLRPYTF